MVDYTFSENKQNLNQEGMWWELEANVHETLFKILRFFDQNQRFRYEKNLQAMKLYGNTDFLGLSAYSYASIASGAQMNNRLALNVVRSMCDTVTNKITKNKPRPMFLTSGGDWSLKRLAKKLTKFSDGVLYETGAYKLGRQAFLDSTVFDFGILHPYEEDGRCVIERVFPQEIEFDQAEAMHGKPRSLYRTKQIAREVLLRRFPKFERQIIEAPACSGSFIPHQNLSSMINVSEAWHLPSFKGAGDGRHVIAIETATLRDESWERNYFPFVFQRWGSGLLGFSGQSLADQITGLQIEINKTLRTIQLSLHLLGIPKIFLQNGSKIIKAHLNNEIGGIVTFTGTPPEVKTFQAVPPQLMEHLEWLRNRAYENAGVSQLAAQSTKPAGLDSGKALREYNDIEAERFMTVGQDYESLYLELVRQCIDVVKDIKKKKGRYEVKVPNKRFMETIDWAELDIDESDFLLQMFPTSFLSNTPSGRLNDVKDLAQAGFIDKPRAMSLMDFPDLESEVSLINAPIEDIEMQIEQIICDGKFSSPEPFQDLQLGLQMFQSAYLRAKCDQVPEERLEMLRRWMATANAMLKPPAPDPSAQNPPAPGVPAPTSPSGAGAGGPPLAVPQASPTSELLPNTPQSA